jgi:uncharacterized membrane protein
MGPRNAAAETAPREKTAIQVIDRMMKLLDALAQSSEPVSLKALSLWTDLLK